MRWALYGAGLSLGSPIGLWALARAVGPEAEVPGVWVYVYVALGSLVACTVFGGYAGRLMDRLLAAAVRDALTGLFNRRFLMETLPRMVAFSHRRGEPMAAMMVDLDRFKRVNDTYGHQVGDRVLRVVAHTLSSEARGSDLVARYGGEEFVVVCPDAGIEVALHIAERLRTAVEGIPPDRLGFPGSQTVSVGIAVCSPGSHIDPQVLLSRADTALYRAKQSGRNRTEVHDEPEMVAPGAVAPQTP